MPSVAWDAFKKHLRGNLVWLDAVGDLQTAPLRLKLASDSGDSGRRLAFDQRTDQTLASVVQLSSAVFNNRRNSQRRS
jgi:hypothetical protein